MTSVVISERFGGFGLSDDAVREYLRRTGRTWTEKPGIMGSTHYAVDGDENWYEREIPRDDTTLVAIVTEMGAEASSRFANLAVIEIPDGVQWHVHEYDGYETLHENHRAWSSTGVEENC